jgi:hypothetical protein
VNDRSRPKAAPESAPTTATADAMVTGRCRVCGVDPPPSHIYCTRVHAMWDRREHLGREVDEPAEEWPR